MNNAETIHVNHSRSTLVQGYWLVLAITVLGGALRVFQLGSEPLWYDEILTLRFAELTWPAMWQQLSEAEVSPPLYYAIQKFWLVFGNSELAVRLPSAIAGTLTIPVIYATARALGGHLVGLVAASLLAVSAIHIQFSQEARPYALVTAAASVSIWGLVVLLTCYRAVESKTRNHLNPRSRPAWAAYILGTTVVIYSHNTAVLLPLIANLIVFVRFFSGTERDWDFLKKWFLANTTIVVLWAPWLPALWYQSTTLLSDTYMTTPSVSDATRLLGRVYGQRFALVRPLADLLLLFFAIRGLWYWRNEPLKPAIVLAFLICVPVLTYLVSIWQPVYTYKVLLWPSTLLFVLIAVGAVRFRHKAPAAFAVATVLGIHVISLPNYYQYYRKQPFNEVTSYISSQRTPSDVVFVQPHKNKIVLDYYFEKFELELPVYDLRKQRGALGPLRSNVDLSTLGEDHSRAWLVVSENRETSIPLMRQLRRQPGSHATHKIKHSSWGLERTIYVFSFDDVPDFQRLLVPLMK